MSSPVVTFTPETNLAFVHISKTGGSWTKRVLKDVRDYLPARPDHCDAPATGWKISSIDLRLPSHYPIDPKLVKLMGPGDDQLLGRIDVINKRQKNLKTIRFANVRNPYDMLGSSFLSGRRSAAVGCKLGSTRVNRRRVHEALTHPDPAEAFPIFCYSFMDPQPHWIRPGYNVDDYSYPFGKPADKFLY